MWIKICGITTADAVAAAAEAGVDAIGFVFAPSPRQVTPGQAAQLAALAPPGILRIAVAQHPLQMKVDEICRILKPDYFQTDVEDLRELKIPAHVKVLPVVRFGRKTPNPLPALMLFEGPSSGVGELADFGRAAELARQTQMILAGGLSPENVAEAIHAVRPYGVDVSSGVEEVPGVKDPLKILAFVRAARAAAAELAGCTMKFPDAKGRYGEFGGRFVPETLIPAFDRLQAGIDQYLHSPDFQAEFTHELTTWVGRPTALSYAPSLSKRWGARVWLKREDLAHTGAHKINNAVGQTLLAKRLGAKRIIAETGAGQHGVASAAAAARLGLPCTVYMGAVDVERQALNVGRMQLMGTTVVPVTSGDQTLRAAIDEALRDWVSDPDGTYYSLGSAVGPHPYPYLVRELQSVIGREARAQMLSQAGGLPDLAVACVGGGSNAIGLFHPFLNDSSVKLLGVEAGGRGPGLGDNAASLTFGTPGVLQGSFTLILQDAFGQVRETHSVSAGLDYSGVGPEHAHLMQSGRVAYESATDDEALDALAECAQCEGILPAIETAHAFAGGRRFALRNPGAQILIACSGRGDKDMPILQNTRLMGAG